MNNIEKLLYAKTVQTTSDYPNQQGTNLFSFWTLLKKQISEQLSVISAIFPHYSLHDNSHSERILDIIWKIYGEKSLQSLSVSNIFVILVVAYAHDLGMTIFSDDFHEAFDSKDFLKLVQEIQADSNNPCYEYANCFEIKNDSLVYRTCVQLNEKSYNAARFLLANYFRNKHAERSKGNVKNIFSQYKSFIKNSVIHQIGEICQAHTKSFDDVLKIPKEENGIYGDSWNPLFVACTLRLGDLLDLESDRFSESYWKSLPTKPFDSEYHRQKHEAIKHFVVNQSIIEATAECPNYDVYKLLLDEFQMVRDEISVQMAHWNKIAPRKDFSSLPGLGDFSVYLKDFDIFDGGKIPAFHINQEKAFELIKGAGIYKDKSVAIREILQNSVDATLITCFLKNEHLNESFEFEDFNDILAKEKIIVSIKKEDNQKSDSDNVIWKISITDSGIGMDKNDLSFLLNVASSSGNPFKKEVISRMPEWLKPSGTFGLGFQSIFQLSREVNVTTRKINNEFEYTLSLKSPAQGIDSSVLLKKKKVDYLCKSGTTVSFNFEVPKMPSSLSISFGESFPNEVVSKFDFATEKSLDYEIAKIITEIQHFGFTSSIPIELHFEDGDPITFQKQVSESIVKRKFYKEYGLELIVPKQNTSPHYCFRNAVILKSDSSIFFIHFSANIFEGNAKDILKINRDEFCSNEVFYNIHEKTIQAGRKYILENYDSLSDKEKFLASMYVRYYEEKDSQTELQTSELFTKWENFTSSFGSKDITFKQVVEFTGKVILDIAHGGNRIHQFSIQKNSDNSTEEIRISTQFNLPDELHFLIKEMLRAGKQLQLADYNNEKITYEFTKMNEGEKYNDFIKDYSVWFRNVLRTANFFSRFTIPCNKKYKKLAIKSENDFIPYEETFRFIRNDFPVGMEMYVMASPYIFERENTIARKLTLKDVDKVIDFTYENRLDSSVSKEEIKKLYDEFISDTAEAVEKENKPMSS